MRYDFGRCHLDTVNREVVMDGAARRLSPKAFELLRLLVEDRPRVVPKAELMQRIWPDSFVEEANLPVLVAEVRAAIGDAGVGDIIKTHHRVGYGFAAEVRETRSHRDGLNSDLTTAAPLSLPPHVQLIQMGIGGWVSAVVYHAARMKLADHLADGPKDAAQVAAATNTHAPTMHRFMRTLAGFGILTEGEGGRFALTPMGEALRSDAPGAAWPTLMAFCGPTFTRAWEAMPHSLATGLTAFEKTWGMPMFDYLGQHPEEASRFSQAMVGVHGTEPPAVAAAYDFSTASTVVDVGGATGNLLAAILSHHPGPRGVLFDRPYVVADAPALLEARGVASRVTIENGNFFEGVPSGGDVYILSHIIHDWNEAQCLTILGHVRQAMPKDGRLLIVETVLPPGDTPHQGKLQDMVMLVFPGGQERTEAEYAALLAKAGFTLTRVVATESPVSIVEAVPA